MVKKIKLETVTVNNNTFFLIAGPCVIENADITFKIAKHLKTITEKIQIPFIFKASFDKANRSSIKGYRGPGIEKGLEILKKIKEKLCIPVTTDIHCISQIEKVAKIVDIIQIPAFLCRQTDLLIEAGKTKKTINVKKGQFLSPFEMKNVIEKILSVGNKNILITERGTFFGYNNLVNDFKGIYIMKNFGFPVVFDATHSVQQPGGLGICSGGNREFIPTLSKAAIAAGCDGIFMEVHPEPEKALSDGPNMLKLNEVENLLKILKKIYKVVNQ